MLWCERDEHVGHIKSLNAYKPICVSCRSSEPIRRCHAVCVRPLPASGIVSVPRRPRPQSTAEIYVAVASGAYTTWHIELRRARVKSRWIADVTRARLLIAPRSSVCLRWYGSGTIRLRRLLGLCNLHTKYQKTRHYRCFYVSHHNSLAIGQVIRSWER
jgi:hypothetical protein